MFRKSLAFALLIFSIVSSSYTESNIEYLLKKNEHLIIRVDGNPSSYIGSLLFDGNKLKLLYESMGFSPTIYAYKVSDERIELLVKSRWTGDEESPKPNEKYPVIYCSIQVELSKNKLSYSCKMTKNISENSLDGFIKADAVINDDDVNVRAEGNTSAKKIVKLKKRTKIMILSIADKYDEVQNMSDYWYKVRNEGIEGYVFGYYISFLNEISIK